ncbi:endonuclease/exonuclease/phosphatase family protein [Rosenbergiella nectarea]|uniref:endonuclease/exonuclease/phosphatase family protein n=1 Tax=Rosenbergiella nectarea TaxID=988801 RepID=UPI003BAD992D
MFVLIFLTLLSCLLLLLTLAPLSHCRYWWVRVWEFPRVQLLAIALILAFAATYYEFDSTLWVTCLQVTTLGCAAYQLFWIYPYTALSRKQVADAQSDWTGTTLKILVSNVLTPNRQADKLVALVEQEKPDVLVAVETDQWWEDQLKPLEQDYPWVIRCPQDNLYGMHVYSRVEVRDAKIQFLVDEAIPSAHLLLVTADGLEVSLHCLHPMPPSPTESDESTDRDAELVMVGKSVEQRDIPVIVTGDMNDVAWSRSTRLFLKVSGLMDPRRGRGMFSTFHASYPFLRWPLDHVFHSKAFVLKDLRRLPSIGSDHYPFYVELLYHPQQGAQQQKLSRTQDDEKLAKEVLNQVGGHEHRVHRPGE